MHGKASRNDRLDAALVTRGLMESREKARRAVMAGRVLVNEQPAAKPGRAVKAEDRVTLIEADRYVSRGGVKLEHALTHFALDVRGLTAIDLGASTGGFTDCLLQHGAAKVCAVDVGQAQLAWKLRQDPRVLVMEKTNARRLTRHSMPAPFVPADLITIDCAFISLQKLLGPAAALLKTDGKIVALLKPQFEAGKEEADRGQGVITDPAVHQRIIGEVRGFVETQTGLAWRGCTESPLLGPAGNKEFLVLLEARD